MSIPDNDNAKRWQRFGTPFQVSMMALFMAPHVIIFSGAPDSNLPVQIVGYAGVAIFVWCLWQLYVKWGRLKGLITTGLFRFTRHPMYLSLLLINFCHWVRVDFVWTSPLFLAIEVAFLACMLAAGYCQERETLARFGREAEDYYGRTPRVPFTPW